MNFSQLQCFIALAETSSFTEAAYSINLTQSAVSHALAALENELGVTLLERNRKGVVALSAVGQKIIPHARAILRHMEAIEQEAKVAKGEASGKLRLGSILSFVSPNLLAGLLTSFQQMYPDVEVVLFEGAMHEVAEWINRSVIDVGFVILPAHDVESQLITIDELCVLVPTSHHLTSRTKVTRQELRAEGFIMEKTQCTVNLLERVIFESGRTKPHIRYQASDSATIFAMVREGLGISLIPGMMLPKRLEGMTAIPLDPPEYLQIGLATKLQEEASPAANLFIQTAQAWTQKQAMLQNVQQLT